MPNHQFNDKSSNINDSKKAESVTKNENVVKITTYEHGNKKEVFVMVFSEEQFDQLIPSTEKSSYH